MKKVTLWASVVGVALAVTTFSAVTQQTPPAAVSGRIPPEEFQATVIKVFSATDGDAVYRAYVVKWKGQEVIADDSLVWTDYHAGDSIPVLATNSPYPNGKAGPRLLHFHVAPPRQTIPRRP